MKKKLLTLLMIILFYGTLVSQPLKDTICVDKTHYKELIKATKDALTYYKLHQLDSIELLNLNQSLDTTYKTYLTKAKQYDECLDTSYYFQKEVIRLQKENRDVRESKNKKIMQAWLVTSGLIFYEGIRIYLKFKL